MKTFIMLVTILFVWNTTQAQTPKPQRVWSNFHTPRKVEYFKLGQVIQPMSMYFTDTLVVIKPRQLNKQIAYVEQGFYKHCSTHKIKRIFKRNCKIKL